MKNPWDVDNTENKDIVITEEAFHQMIIDSHKYIYNLMGFDGEYDEDTFQAKFKEIGEAYSVLSDKNKNVNRTVNKKRQ